MLITIERAALLRALGHVQSVVEKRNTIPILSNVLLRADGDALTLTATDMDLEIQESVAAAVGRPGATTAPAHTLYDIVRKLPDGSQVELDFGADRGALMLRAGRAQFRLGCLPVEDYPQMNSGELPHRLSLQAAELRTIVDRTRFAISTEETRYYLNGIYLHATPARGGEARLLRAVATDGHRLARFEMALPEGAESIPGVIVPRKTVGEVRKLIEEAGAPIEVALSETQIRFTIDHIVLTSKLIDGTFPDYERVIPSGNDKVLTVDTKVFAAAVDRVATIS
ncbi:MAG TPA: DNA polymerase III subunit beta, partial [Alphaproteobacteria bacterium]|nr:DNA polymerase III subunit beta [Alphaproteobacteria bacterium]